jgi:cbb3-type cytochrome oxidase subunit 1
MRGISFWFFMTATVYVTIGMLWGIHMSASGDHSLAPAHAHLNLIGWVTMALFGIYYHLVPKAAGRVLAKVHFAVATAGVVIIVPGIVMAIEETGEVLAKLGSLLTLLSMLIFVFTVFRNRDQPAG